jgi:hypothetical protein
MMGVYGLETKADHCSHANGIRSPPAAIDERLHGRRRPQNPREKNTVDDGSRWTADGPGYNGLILTAVVLTVACGCGK